MPTLDDLKNVFNIPEEDGPEKEKAEEFLLWYFDHWLPHCAGCEHYGPTICPYVLATDLKVLEDGTVMEDTPNVSLQGEAFGLTMMENCHTKWIAIFKWRDANGWGIGVTLPPYNKEDPTTHPLHVCKWSDCRNGKGTGWKPEASVQHKQNCKYIDKLRRKDAKNGGEKYALGKAAIRREHEITADTYSKKRKRKETVVAASTVEWVDDEDDWSVGSDATP